MPGDYFWQCVDALAATFDGAPMVVEENLAIYMDHCGALPKESRLELRRQMVQIIGGLAQLETRLAEMG